MRRCRNGVVAMMAAALLVCMAQNARALWLAMQVTRSGSYGLHRITVTSRTAKGYIEYDVQIAPNGQRISPFLSAELTLVANGASVAVVPVSEFHEKDCAVYRFRVAPPAVERSFLEVSVGSYAPARGSKGPFRRAVVGKQQVEEIMGGTIYRIALKDFAVSAQR